MQRSRSVRKAPSRRDTSLYIATPTLVQLNAAQKNKEWKDKENYATKQNLTPSTNGQMQWRVVQFGKQGARGATRYQSYNGGSIKKQWRRLPRFFTLDLVPFEETPLVAPNIATVLASVLLVTTVLAVVAAILTIIPTVLRGVPGLAVGTVVVVAVVAVAANSELDARSHVKKMTRRSKGINPHKQHHRQIHVGQLA